MPDCMYKLVRERAKTVIIDGYGDEQEYVKQCYDDMGPQVDYPS